MTQSKLIKKIGFGLVGFLSLLAVEKNYAQISPQKSDSTSNELNYELIDYTIKKGDNSSKIINKIFRDKIETKKYDQELKKFSDKEITKKDSTEKEEEICIIGDGYYTSDQINEIKNKNVFFKGKNLEEIVITANKISPQDSSKIEREEKNFRALNPDNDIQKKLSLTTPGVNTSNILFSELKIDNLNQNLAAAYIFENQRFHGNLLDISGGISSMFYDLNEMGIQKTAFPVLHNGPGGFITYKFKDFEKSEGILFTDIFKRGATAKLAFINNELEVKYGITGRIIDVPHEISKRIPELKLVPRNRGVQSYLQLCKDIQDSINFELNLFWKV